MKTKKFIFWFLMIMIDVIIVFGICEIWVRNFIPVTNISYYHDHQLGDMMTPNQQTYGYVEANYSNILHTNSLGLHDIERSIVKKSGTYRIQIYGDSLTSGVGVQIEDTIPSLVEQYLNSASKPTSKKFEVMNMASGEDSTSAEFLVYQKIGKQFSPDLVVCYFMADFPDNILETHHRTRSPYHTINENGELEFLPPIPVDLNTPWEQFKKGSMLYRLFANKLLASKIFNDAKKLGYKLLYSFSQKETKQRSPKNNLKDSYTEKRLKVLKEKSWPVTLKLLSEFKKTVEKNGSRFIVIHGRTLNEGNTGGYTNSDFIHYLENNHIDYISAYKIYDEIRYHRPKEEDLFFKDAHPKPAGNKLLSKQIATKLKIYIDTGKTQ